MNQTDTLLLQCAHTVKATGSVSMVRVYRAMTALLEPLAKDDHELAHALSKFVNLVIQHCPYWLEFTLTPYRIGTYAFDLAPSGSSLEAVARTTIYAAFKSLEDALGDALEDALSDALKKNAEDSYIETSKYWDARAVIDQLRLATLKSFKACYDA